MGCGDHRSDEHTEIHLRTDSQGIHATQYVYKCQQDFKLGPFISKENLSLNNLLKNKYLFPCKYNVSLIYIFCSRNKIDFYI
jgi:hypothetical protein